MITAVALDDEPKAISIIKAHASKIDDLTILATFFEPEEALRFMKENPIDLLFLDINMPGMSGFDALNELRIKPCVIITTAYSTYALQSYEYEAVDYLLKPFEFDRFQIAINKVKERISHQRRENTYCFIKDGFKNIKICFEDILFIKGCGNYLDIQTVNKIYSPRMTFQDLLNILPTSGFARIHNSYIINLNKVEKVENNHLFINEMKFSIGNKYKEQLYLKLRLDD